MPKHSFVFLFVLAILFACFSSCKKVTEINIQPSAPFATAGTNQTDVMEFSVKLNADSLKKGQTGKWTIASGLQEDNKVYFDDAAKADTHFHGMPGETYVLKWSVSGYSDATVKITFKPLQTSITNSSPNNQTQFFLSAKGYDSGQWNIEGGTYAYIRNQTSGGTYLPDINAPNMKFQGYAYHSYKLTWTTRYGSKSASASIILNTGYYLEREGLQELQLDPASYRVTFENGHITGLDLSSSGIAWVFADTVACPAIQAFTNLKRLNLTGSATFKFPAVFGDRFQNLEYLNLESTIISSIPDNIGQLKKLRELDLQFLQQGASIYSLPSTFGQLESLETLRLAASGIQQVPDSFGKLQKLRYCDMSNNNIQYFPGSIGNCISLEHLAVVTQGGILSSISKLTNLRYLFWGTSVSTSLPLDIGNMSSLDTLELQANLNSLPTSFANLPVRRLSISGQGLPTLPNNFGNLRNLEDLTLGGSFSNLPASFSSLTKLIYCTVNSTNLSTLPADIGNLKTMQYLDCSYGKLTGLPASIGDLTALTELRLGQNKINTLPVNFFLLPKIKKIDLANNQLATLPDDFQKLKNTLSLLYLQGNPYPPADLVKIKQLLPTTGVYPY
jgi:Leucine-rich repeat (LRR) protein